MNQNNRTSPQLQVQPAALQYSKQLAEIIKKAIEKNGGQITFAHYMELALYAPQYGYYTSQKEKFGAQGDFITAPEISPLFGQCVARQCQQILQSIPQGDIIEFGPGNGTLASQILTALAENNCLPQHYYLVELSANLRQRQQETLEKLPDNITSRVIWLDHFPLQKPINGIVIANEVLDAMPVHRFRISEDHIQEAYIKINNDEQFYWHYDTPSDARLTTAVEQLQQSVLAGINFYESEINLNLVPWLQTVADALARGLVLIIDYGFPQHEYYHSDRSAGTLMCHYQHHSLTDPLILPGLLDITSHVDFTAVATAAHYAGMTIEGYTSQAAFLLSCGLLDLAQQQEDAQQSLGTNMAIKKLTLPSEMGELVKVIALTKQLDGTPLLGFSLQNNVNKL